MDSWRKVNVSHKYKFRVFYVARKNLGFLILQKKNFYDERITVSIVRGFCDFFPEYGNFHLSSKYKHT